MAREDRWRDRFDWRDEERRMSARPDYGQSDPGYGYGDYRSDYRGGYRYDAGRADYERRMDEARRREEETRERRERAYAPFGSAGPTAYGLGPGFVDPATGYAPFAPTNFPYGAMYGSQGAAYGGAGLSSPRPRPYHPDDPRARSGQVAGEHRSFLDKAADEVASWFGGEKQPDHRGRGPKGYRRSDERIREDVSDRLTDDPYLDASEIEVTVASGEITLTGLVATREDKRRAERLAEQVSGVEDVQNNIKIRRAETGDGVSGTDLGARG